MRKSNILGAVAAALFAVLVGGEGRTTPRGAKAAEPEISAPAAQPTVAGGTGTVTLVGEPARPSWRQVLADRLPLYGHRNWIVIADSAYPQQTRDGIETVVTGADQVEVVKEVLAALEGARHVRPIVYTDAEMKFVTEQDAPGITAYRQQLAEALGGRDVQVVPHEEVIKKLDEAGQTFKVLILKTNLTIPYTSVFLRLDCKYWSADAEKRLRAAMGQ